MLKEVFCFNVVPRSVDMVHYSSRWLPMAKKQLSVVIGIPYTKITKNHLEAKEIDYSQGRKG